MEGNKASCSSAKRSGQLHEKHGSMRSTQGRSCATGILIAATALALAACSGPSSPQVASLGTSTTSPGTGTSTRSTPAALPAGDPTRLVDQWADCERSHGDPDQTDPTIDASAVIHITIPQDAQPTGDIHELTGTCSEYLAAAQNKLRAANPVAPPPDQAELLKYVNCMRANGVPNYPYPTGDTTNFIGSGVDPNSPSVERVNQLCGKKLDLPPWWVDGSDTPGSIEVQTAGHNPDTTPPSCLFAKNPCSATVTVPGSNSGSGPNG
jgi:hypothetical protein